MNNLQSFENPSRIFNVVAVTFERCTCTNEVKPYVKILCRPYRSTLAFHRLYVDGRCGRCMDGDVAEYNQVWEDIAVEIRLACAASQYTVDEALRESDRVLDKYDRMGMRNGCEDDGDVEDDRVYEEDLLV